MIRLAGYAYAAGLVALIAACVVLAVVVAVEIVRGRTRVTRAGLAVVPRIMAGVIVWPVTLAYLAAGFYAAPRHLDTLQAIQRKGL